MTTVPVVSPGTIDIMGMSYVLWHDVVPRMGLEDSDLKNLLVVAEVFFPLVPLVAKFIVEKLTLCPAFSFSVYYGSAETRVAHFIFNKWNGEPEFIGRASWGPALSCACKVGNSVAVKWLCAQYGLRSSDLDGQYGGNPILVSLHEGHLEIAQWLVESLRLKWSTCRDWDFSNFFATGHLDGILWLSKAVGASLLKEHTAWEFVEACTAGNLENAKWLHATFPNTNVTAQFNALSKACLNGRLDVAKWLASTYGFDNFSRLTKQCTVTCIRQGYLSTAEWMLDMSGMSLREALGSYYENVGALAERNAQSGNLVALEWVSGHFELGPHVCREIFFNGASYGQLGTCQWVFPKCSALDHTFLCECLNGALLRGHADMADWLCKTFQPNVMPSLPIWQACCHNGGELATVQWMLRNLPAPKRCSGLTMSCLQGNLPLVKFLSAAYSATPEDIRDNENEALRSACGHGHLHVAKWITQEFGLNKADAQCGDQNEALWQSFQNGHLETALWVMETFKFTTKDIPSWYLWRACEYGSLHTIKWLANVVPLSIEHKPRYDEAIQGMEQAGHLDTKQFLEHIFEQKMRGPNSCSTS
ncbi:hypothetical protein Pelo_16 [Pelomyxa schiedti]|nr:hypothetical protein Pelo_16 [Pelomyxa schiedti]